MVSAGRVLRLGLLLLVAALLFPVLSHLKREITEDPLDIWADHLLTGAFILIGVAIILSLLEKTGLRVSGARCADCKRPIEHGKLYCRDHLKARIEAAREKYRGHSGMGL